MVGSILAPLTGSEALDQGMCGQLFARGIAQYVSTTRAPALYRDPVTAKSATLNGSALLAYKLNWQSVMFVGFGDDRELSDVDRLEKLDRQFFVKLSYAFQR